MFKGIGLSLEARFANTGDPQPGLHRYDPWLPGDDPYHRHPCYDPADLNDSCRRTRTALGTGAFVLTEVWPPTYPEASYHRYWPELPRKIRTASGTKMLFHSITYGEVDNLSLQIEVSFTNGQGALLGYETSSPLLLIPDWMTSYRGWGRMYYSDFMTGGMVWLLPGPEDFGGPYPPFGNGEPLEEAVWYVKVRNIAGGWPWFGKVWKGPPITERPDSGPYTFHTNLGNCWWNDMGCAITEGCAETSWWDAA